MELSERKKQILKSVIDAYIDSGEPVGSKYLTASTDISLSSATIRNEMSELEQLGYLDKPHTSAGRVPSSMAYRLYVDELMESYRLTMEELEVINELMKYKSDELDKIIARAGKIMSDLTGCVTLSVTESQRRGTIKRFDVLAVDTGSLLLVIIDSDGKARSEQINTDKFITDGALMRLKKSLNDNITGLTLAEITMPVIMKAELEAGEFSELINPIIRMAFKVYDTENDGNVNINGISNLLSYPEFSDVGKLKSIMDVFDRKGYIKQLLTDGTELAQGEPTGDGGLKIYIGGGDSSSALADTSVVYCTLPMGKSEAVIGILGPKRMDYRKVVSTLKQFTRSIESAMGELPSHEDNTEEN